jgi:putative DNA primase/helicase
MNFDSDELKNVAFQFWQQGFVVVPIVFVREGDDVKKQPLVEWKKWQNEEQTLQEFESLPWDRAEGFEVLCGKPNKQGVSVGVVDFDVKRITPEAQALGRKALSLFRVTARERTQSGGEHLIFYSRKPPKTISSYHGVAALELLGESKLCVMYPSRGYSKINDNLPTVVDDLEAEFLEALRKVGVAKAKAKRELPVRPCFRKLMEKSELTHDERVALVNELEHQGYSKGEIKEVFHENKAWEPEYKREKTDYQIESVYGQYGHFTREELKQRGICFEDCPLEGYRDCRRPRDIERYFENGAFIPKLLAEELMSEYHFATMKDTDQIYVYMDGFYQPYGEVLIRQECKIRLQGEYRKNRVGEVIDYIKASTYTNRREELPNLIPLENGVLNIDTMGLKPFRPEYMFFNKLPVKYDPEATCPQIKKFLFEVAGAKEDVDILIETVAFCLYREYFIAKALMLVGGGSNGKSTFLNLVKEFMGKENVSCRSLQDLEDNRFAKADLHHKLANIYADLPDRALWRTGTFKMLTGRDLIAAERKFQQSFTFENYAKLLFSANKVPEAYDDTDAFFRRWLIVVFPNQFVNDKADPYILQKLTTPEELSGLLNLALAALQRLRKTGRFSSSKATDEIRQDYIRKSSPIAAFVMDCLAVDSDAFIVKKDLFKVFAAYCRERKIPCVTETTFFKNLPQHVAVAEVRPSVEKERVHAFKGLRYSEGVSVVSEVSRVFYTLSEKASMFEDEDKWVVERLPEAGIVRIKYSKNLDKVDRTDTKQGKTLPFTVEDILKLEHLTTNVQDKCCVCGFDGRMDWQVTLRSGEWGLLCEKCGGDLSKKLGRGEMRAVWEWEGFHAVGSMATPEKSFRKTVDALLEYVEIEKTSVISDASLTRLFDYYWTRESHERVTRRLLERGYLKPFGSGKFLIVENLEVR